MNRGRRLRALWLLVTLAACQQPRQAAVDFVAPVAIEVTPVPSPSTVGSSPLPVTLAPTSLSTPAADPGPRATAAPSPAQETRQEPVLAVSPRWGNGAAAAANPLSSACGKVGWKVRVDQAPAAALGRGEAQAALTPNGDGLVVFSRPLALAVPWATPRERVTLAEAQAILAEGDSSVQALPWSDMIPSHRALTVDGLQPDDPGYPLQERWHLVGAPGYEEAVGRLASQLQASLVPDPVVHLVAVGDIVLDRGPGMAIQQGDLAYPFSEVADTLRAADLTIGNLECAPGDIGEPEDKSYTFRAPEQAAASLALAGFDLVSLANNHGMDFGAESLLQGIRILAQQGVETSGAGETDAAARAPLLREIHGLALAFLAYVNVPLESNGFDTQDWAATSTTAGLAWGTPDVIATDVAAARSAADLVIVILHSGQEYVEAPSEPQVAAAHAAIDAGAHLVIGHHAHVLQGIEFYRDGVIVYGLGNFAFQITGPPETAILSAWLDSDGVRQLELTPAIVQTSGQPRLAIGGEAVSIRQQVYLLTTLLNPP